MKNLLTLSVIVPSIRTENWTNIYKSILENIKNYSFEVIFIGPDINLPDNLKQFKNIKCIRDFGCPSRAMQMGCVLAEGKYLSWACDDGVFVDFEISKILDELEKSNNEKIWYNWIYTEGPGYLYGADMRISNPHQWYKAKFHDNQKNMNGIDDSWYMTLLFTINSDYFRKMGGINCQYEAINYNLHDLGYRMTRDGAEMRFTNNCVFRLSWQQEGQNNRTIHTCPVLNATHLNDEPLLENMYGQPKELPIKINLDNWRDSDIIWIRKWAQKHIN